jgi:hypothetical protein
MALTVNNKADREILYRLLGTAQDGSWQGKPGDTMKLCLYKGGRAIGVGDSKYGLIESSGSGYAKIILAPNSWVISTTLPANGDTNMASYAQQTFTYTGADSVAGYYMSTMRMRGSLTSATSDSTIMWREAFTDGPYIIPAGGGTIKITPRLIMR